MKIVGKSSNKFSLDGYSSKHCLLPPIANLENKRCNWLVGWFVFPSIWPNSNKAQEWPLKPSKEVNSRAGDKKQILQFSAHPGKPDKTIQQDPVSKMKKKKKNQEAAGKWCLMRHYTLYIGQCLPGHEIYVVAHRLF